MGNGSCFQFKRRQVRSEDAKAYEPLLHQEEKEAVSNLLKYYDEGTLYIASLKRRVTQSFIDNFQLLNLSRDQLKALTVLSYSENEELQRTAAFFFSEISEQCEFVSCARGRGSNALCRHT